MLRGMQALGGVRLPNVREKGVRDILRRKFDTRSCGPPGVPVARGRGQPGTTGRCIDLFSSERGGGGAIQTRS